MVKKREKLFFWLILSLFSVFFAEILSGSYVFPFFTAWGIFVIIPLYGLHILVLASLVYNYSKPNLYTLLSAGLLFGMYEAYITKVLWYPSWGNAVFKLYGVAIVETVVLVLFWHLFMSFLIPLIIAEGLFAKSSSIMGNMPKWVQDLFSTKEKMTRFLIVFAVFFGAVLTGNAFDGPILFIAGFSSAMVLLFFTYLWKRKKRDYTLKELLPDKKEFKVLLGILLMFYLFWTLALTPQKIPGLLPQFVIWMFYGLITVLIVKTFKYSKEQKKEKKFFYPVKFSYKTMFFLAVILSVSSFLTKTFLGPFSMMALILVWFGGGIFGIFMLYLTVKQTF